MKHVPHLVDDKKSQPDVVKRLKLNDGKVSSNDMAELLRCYQYRFKPASQKKAKVFFFNEDLYFDIVNKLKSV